MNNTYFKTPSINSKFKQNLLSDFVATYEKDKKLKVSFIFPFAFGFTILVFALFSIVNQSKIEPESPPIGLLNIASISDLDSQLFDLETELNADTDILSAINFDKLD